ncbi:hypothetical protein N7G274_003941 [Stereocaulon virgatum]|uniref:Ecp2 effector protein domain-containing protein n=1 Tax=Stereocaulon virgatum TaxID=373712 RepID=A0ABR4ACT3_9LECA
MSFILIPLTLASITFATPTNSATRSLAVSDTSLTGAILSQPNTTTPHPVTTTDSFHIFPINCFNPEPIVLSPAFPEDCESVIDNVLLRLATDPMAIQTWGFTDDQDINLSLEENRYWRYDQCVIFMRAVDLTQVDRFRVVDAALAAKKILQKCVLDSKLAKGGTAEIGTHKNGFYIVLGGWNPVIAANDTGSSYTSKKTVLSLSRNTERSITVANDASA